MRKSIFWMVSFLVLCSVFLLNSCSKSPMDELKSDRIYADMNETFWLGQFNQKTKLWTQAFQYCTWEAGGKPNCGPVEKIALCGGDCDKPLPRY